jgi:hypothetical protein
MFQKETNIHPAFRKISKSFGKFPPQPPQKNLIICAHFGRPYYDKQFYYGGKQKTHRTVGSGYNNTHRAFLHGRSYQPIGVSEGELHPQLHFFNTFVTKKSMLQIQRNMCQQHF